MKHLIPALVLILLTACGGVPPAAEAIPGTDSTAGPGAPTHDLSTHDRPLLL